MAAINDNAVRSPLQIETIYPGQRIPSDSSDSDTFQPTRNKPISSQFIPGPPGPKKVTYF